MEDFVTQRQAAPRDDKPDHDLHAVGAVVPAVATPCRRIALGQTLEVRARQVVQQHVEGLIKQRPQARLEMRLQRRLVRQQMVQRPVEPILVHPLLRHTAQVLERRPRIETLLDRELARGGNQARRGQDEGHRRPRDLLPAWLHPLLEHPVQTQKTPQVLHQEELAEVSRPLPPHSLQNDLGHTLAARHHRSIGRKQFQLALGALAVEDRDRPTPRRF